MLLLEQELNQELKNFRIFLIPELQYLDNPSVGRIPV